MLSTENLKEYDAGNGTHWVACCQQDKAICLFDSFARKTILNNFINAMHQCPLAEVFRAVGLHEDSAS